MSFGKRGSDTRRQRSSKPKLPTETAAAEATAASPLWVQLRTLGIGVATGLLCFVLFAKVVMPEVGRRFEADWETPAGEKALRSYKADNGLDAFRLSRICPTPTFGVKLHARGRDPLTSEQAMILGEGENAKTLAGFITCTLVNMRERFCQNDARAALNDQLSHYLSMRRAGLRIAAAAMRTSVGQLEAFYAHMMSEHGGREAVEARGGEARNPEQFKSMHALMRVDPAMIAALRALIEDGYMAPADFAGFLGLFMPSELAPHISGLSSTKRPCP